VHLVAMSENVLGLRQAKKYWNRIKSSRMDCRRTNRSPCQRQCDWFM